MEKDIRQIIEEDDLDAFVARKSREWTFWYAIFEHKAVKIWKYLLDSKSVGLPVTDDPHDIFSDCFGDALKNKRWDIIALSLPIMCLETIQDWVTRMTRDTLLTSYLLTKGIPLYGPSSGKLRAITPRMCLLMTIGFTTRQIDRRIVDITWSHVIEHIDIAPSFDGSIEETEICDLSIYDNTRAPNDGGHIPNYHALLSLIVDDRSTNWVKRLLTQITLTDEQQQAVFSKVWSTQSMKLLQLLHDKRIPSSIPRYHRDMAQMVIDW